jgi:hypothetical protein
MAKKPKLPKRIAGVKIPKKLRKSATPFYELVNQPAVRNVASNLIAVGLIAAADAMTKTKPAKKAGKKVKRAAEQVGETAAESAINVSNVLAFAAREAAKAIKSR